MDVFPSDLCLGLPPLRGIEHQIDLLPGATLSDKLAYRCNPIEAKELQRQVEQWLIGDTLEKALVLILSSFTYPNKDETMRMYVDSRAINNIIIKYRYHIPRLDDMLDELLGSRVFSRINLRSGYHHIRMRDGDEWKATIKTKQDLYEWLLMHLVCLMPLVPSWD